MTKPVAITMGDPSGVGPELIEKLVSHYPQDDILIFGDARLFPPLPSLPIDDYQAGPAVIDMPCAVTPIKGQSQGENAKAVIAAIESAVQAVKGGQAGALLTAPINKAHLHEGAGFAYPGHTEFLAALDGQSRSVMMIATPDLRVVPVTIHIPLSEVPKALTPALLKETIAIAAADLKRYLGRDPRIVVAGLNPHAGENGHIGREELNWIAPLVESLKSTYNIKGPLPADTLFHKTARVNYDVAICMYHDQALIPAKTLGFDEGVNVTLGLSFLRTSPDHGTAYDIAGQNIADPKSFFKAYELAKEWSAR